MPASRARAAICSAPLEWPSRPGFPTRNFKRRRSFFDTRSTSARMSSRPSASLRMAVPTPVGARYSPNAARSAKPHSPVVTPALAQAIEAGMMLAPPRAAWRSALSASPRFQPRDLFRLGFFGYGDNRACGLGERRGLGLDEAVDANHDLFAALDRFDPARVRFDELLLEVALLDGGDGAAHLVDLCEFLLGCRFELRDLG